MERRREGQVPGLTIPCQSLPRIREQRQSLENPDWWQIGLGNKYICAFTEGSETLVSTGICLDILTIAEGKIVRKCDESSLLLSLGLTWGTPGGIDSWCSASALAVSRWPAAATLPEPDYQTRLAGIWHFTNDKINSFKDWTQEIQRKDLKPSTQLSKVLSHHLDILWSWRTWKVTGRAVLFLLLTQARVILLWKHFRLSCTTAVSSCDIFKEPCPTNPQNADLFAVSSRQPGISCLKGFTDSSLAANTAIFSQEYLIIGCLQARSSLNFLPSWGFPTGNGREESTELLLNPFPPKGPYLNMTNCLKNTPCNILLLTIHTWRLVFMSLYSTQL